VKTACEYGTDVAQLSHRYTLRKPRPPFGPATGERCEIGPVTTNREADGQPERWADAEAERDCPQAKRPDPAR
jgi:hypothetical protein